MSQPSQTKKSKIPLYNGGTKKKDLVAARMVSTDSKLTAFRQRTEKEVGPTCRRQILKEAQNNSNIDEIGEIPFETDQQALDSILNNEGIVPGASVKTSSNTLKVGKVSSVFDRSAPNRMSMMESLTDFKKSLKVYKEKIQQLDINTKFESDPKALKSILDGQGITPTITKRASIYYQPPANRTSMLESYESFKENVKLFRAKMQKLENETPRGGSKVASKTSSNQGKEGVTKHKQGIRSGATGNISATPSSSSSSMSRSGNAWSCERAWSASKEKRTPTLIDRRPFSFSASKINSSKITDKGNKSEFAYSAQKINSLGWGVKSCQKRLSALCESPEAGGQQKVDSVDKMCNINGKLLETRHVVSEVLSPANVQNVQSALSQTKSCSNNATGCSVSQTWPYSISDGSYSTKCVMSNSRPVCTPAKVTHIVSTSQTDIASGNSNCTAINSAPSATAAGGISITSHSLSETQGSVINKITQQFSEALEIKEKEQSASSLNDRPPYNFLNSTCNQSLQTDTVCKQLHQSASTPSISDEHLVSYQANPLSTPTQQFPVRPTTLYMTTPTPKALRVPVKHNTPSPASRIPVKKDSPSPCIRRSPFTPRNTSYLNRPPLRTPALSSCLKSKNNNILHVRNASSTVKKLRWADADS